MNDFAEALHAALDRNTWSGGNILRGELPTYPSVTSLPTAAAEYRYRTAMVTGAAGAADALYVCMKDAADAYNWRAVTTT